MVDRKTTTFDFSGHAERLGVEVQLLEHLQKPDIGIFEGVESSTIEAILNQAEVLSFKEDNEKNNEEAARVFVAGEPTNDCLYIILDGQFSVNYEVKAPKASKEPKFKPVAFNEAPMLLGDVEFLVHDLDEDILLQSDKNLYLSTVKCEIPGRVLKIPHAQSVVWSTPSLALTRNIAKLLGIKLSRGEARNTMPPRYKILEYLHGLVKDDKKVREIEINQSKRFKLNRPVTYKAVARAIGHPENTVSSCYNSTLEEKGLVWYENVKKRWVFTMSSEFYAVLISEQWADLLKKH